jgi:hypothetical protein
MSIGRIIGYSGIAILLLFAVIGIVISWASHDWYGLSLMAAFIGLLVFFGHGLIAAAKREANPELAANSGLGWYGESVGALFRGPVLHTPEGLALVGGSVSAVLFALLALVSPTLVGLNPTRSTMNATLFSLWPIVLFVIYVKFSSPDFRPRLATFLVVLCAALFPYYLAYR